jgi:hypothetical protein
VDQARGGLGRIGRAWRSLAGEQRLAGVAALLLLLTLFLPWYQKSIYDPAIRDYADDTLTGFGSADFVMASIVLVGLGVIALLFARGEGRGFHLPGGDGTVIMAAGAWAALLIFYRVLDHPDVSGRGATIGIQWGVFVAFLAAAFLIYAGYRIRSADRPEPPLPLDPPTVRASRGPAPRPDEPPPSSGGGSAEDPTAVSRTRRRRPVAPRPPDDQLRGQMSFDEPETEHLPER